MQTVRSWWLVVGLGVSWAGCSTTPEPLAPGDEVEATAPRVRPRSSGGPSIESEIGALDEDGVKKTFHEARPAIEKCLRGANLGLDMPIVGGELAVSLRVKGDGSLRWARATRSTIGHHATEECVLDVLRGLRWPKPQGGDEGLAHTDYAIDPPGRAPVAWSVGDLGDAGSALTRKLMSCRSDAGTATVSVTVYVDPDGGVIAAGAAAGEDNGPAAIDCAIRAAKAMRFPSPGSYPAKVTVTVP